MKKKVVIIVAISFIISMFTGCLAQKNPEILITKTTALTETELAYFNGDSFSMGSIWICAINF